jgi:hypothetical protein
MVIQVFEALFRLTSSDTPIARSISIALDTLLFTIPTYKASSPSLQTEFNDLAFPNNSHIFQALTSIRSSTLHTERARLSAITLGLQSPTVVTCGSGSPIGYFSFHTLVSHTGGTICRSYTLVSRACVFRHPSRHVHLMVPMWHCAFHQKVPRKWSCGSMLAPFPCSGTNPRRRDPKTDRKIRSKQYSCWLEIEESAVFMNKTHTHRNRAKENLAAFRTAFKYDLSCVLQQGNAQPLQQVMIVSC